MGYFLHKFGIKPFKEAEADGQDLENPNDQPTEYTDNPPVEDTNQEPTNDQPMEEPPAPNEAPPEEDTTDYTEENIGDTGEESMDNEENPPPENEQPVDEIKQQEEELMDLSPEELDIKHKELKTQFLLMYDMTTSIIDRIGDASINEENIGVVEFISDTLSRLRDMLTDYMDDVYSTKSYIENSVNYNRFLAVLNGINKLLEELDKKEDK